MSSNRLLFLPKSRTLRARQLSAPLVKAVTTPEIVEEEVVAPPPLPVLDVFAPCETLGDVAPAPVKVVVAEAPAPAPKPAPEPAPPPPKEPIPAFAGEPGSVNVCCTLSHSSLFLPYCMNPFSSSAPLLIGFRSGFASGQRPQCSLQHRRPFPRFLARHKIRLQIWGQHFYGHQRQGSHLCARVISPSLGERNRIL